MDFQDEQYFKDMQMWFAQGQPTDQGIVVHPMQHTQVRNSECPICLDIMPDHRIDTCHRCKYGFHRQCLTNVPKCPMCRNIFGERVSKSKIVTRMQYELAHEF